MSSIHRAVLLNEIIEGLDLGKDSIVLDTTYGGGGHSKEILKRFPEIRLISIDQDKSTDAAYHENFRNLDAVLVREKVGQIDSIIFDLGLSSDQLEHSGRGFTFAKDEPLAMTMDPDADLTAEVIANNWSEKNLADIIYGYGEERYARRIAKAIVETRSKKSIRTTGELVKIIEGAVRRRGKVHPATKTFQALRIAVNDELGSLKEGLEKGFRALKGGGRMAVISFHSLEDRIVKNFNKEKVKEGGGKLINKKPIVASEEEIKNNKRARSAKLRVIEKIK
ncbi:MAG: 16S rRNA (cytosine(1402)-N(4))-methyltransferase RsmH [Patescibacteria group bacterium]